MSEKATRRDRGEDSRFAVQTGAWEFTRALTVVDRLDVLDTIIEDLDANRPGPKRVLPWRAWFVAQLIAVSHWKGTAHMTKAQDVFDGFTPSQRHALGLRGVNVTYAQIESGLEVLTQAMQERVDYKTGEVFDTRLSISAHDIANSLIAATLPEGLPYFDEIAIDSTDFETDAARRSRASLNVLGDDDKMASAEKMTDTNTQVVDSKVVRTSTHRTRGGHVAVFPMKGDDGRWQHSLDPDARDGYRSGKQMGSKEVFLGYDLHIAVPTPATSGLALPGLAYGIEVTAAGASKAAAGLRLIDRVKARAKKRAQNVTSVTVDRGYSMARLAAWALPLIDRGIVQHHDLGSKESRLAPGPHPGVIYLDGHPYLAVMPKRLKELRRPGLDANAEEVAESARQYNERAPYAFSTNGPVRPNGAQRYRGPVLTKKVRCPNHPESMRWAETKPLTNCTPGEACACSLTFTVQADDRVTKHRQPELYGTENWLKRYGARNLVESFNASLKKHHMKLARHSTRLFGLAKNTIMLGFIVAATNIAVLRQRYGYDPAKPHTMPTPGATLMPLPQKEKTGSNARHPESPPPEGGPPPPVPDEEPWIDLN